MAPAGGRELPDTPTWAVAVVVLVLVLISVALEHALHKLTHWFHHRHKKALAEALEKMKAELMLVGFISLLLTVFQDPISKICISKEAGDVMLPCHLPKAADYADKGDKGSRRRLLSLFQAEMSHRRSLAAAVADVCAEKGKVALMSAGSLHQLHIFIFVLAVFHVAYSVVTMALSRLKMRRWKKWEAETASLEYQFANGPSKRACDLGDGTGPSKIWGPLPMRCAPPVLMRFISHDSDLAGLRETVYSSAVWLRQRPQARDQMMQLRV